MEQFSYRRPQGENIVSLRDLWDIFLEHWRWFALSAALTLSLAMIYIIITPPQYTRSTSILIKDNEHGRPSSVPIDEFSSLELFNTNTNIKNEVHIIQSPLLIKSVVRRLKLDHNYQINYKSVRMVDIYNGTPVAVRLSTPERNDKFSFTISLKENNNYVLSDFNLDNNVLEGEVEGKFFEEVQTPCGKMKLEPTASYIEGMSDQLIYFTKSNRQQVIDYYCKALQVAQSDDEASVINLSITDMVPQRAEDFLATLVSVYNESWIRDKNQVTSSTSRFINERLNVIEQELGGMDKNISSYKSSHLLPDVNAVSGMYLAQSNTNTSNLYSLNNQLAMARYVYDYMNEKSMKNQLIPANTGLENTNIESQIDKYNNLFLQRNSLLANSSERNPLIIDMNQSLQSMRDMIIKSINDYIATLNIQIENTRREERQTNQKLATNPSQANYLLTVERQQKVKEALYLFLLQQREENELSQAFTAYNTRIIIPPQGASDPTAPRRLFLLQIALMAGLCIPGLFLFLFEIINPYIRSKKDLEGLSVPFVGEIPLAPSSQKIWERFRRKKRVREDSFQPVVVVREKSRDIINEAFRSVRTNIDFMLNRKENGTVLMTTSIHPESGKTFTTLNLALSMALKGSRVVMIDIDLRRASLSNSIHSPKNGLSNFLNKDEKHMDNIIIKSHLHDNLDIIPVGTIPPNPSELLLNGRLEALLVRLRQQYDYIFCDCPPIGLVTDASIVAKSCDMTLFIVRAGLMDRRLLPDIEDLYSSKQFNNMCIILYGQKIDKHVYGYRRYGYHSYGYWKESYGQAL